MTIFTIVALIGSSQATEKSAIKKGKWNGFEREDFKVEGRDSILVHPQTPRADKAWVLRPAWFGAFPNADMELLKRGFHLAYFDVTHFYANFRSMMLMDKFYDYMAIEHGLSRRVSLEGLSRGGAAALCWANRNPSKVACVYMDAPVCDFMSWIEKEKNKKTLGGILQGVRYK